MTTKINYRHVFFYERIQMSTYSQRPRSLNAFNRAFPPQPMSSASAMSDPRFVRHANRLAQATRSEGGANIGNPDVTRKALEARFKPDGTPEEPEKKKGFDWKPMLMYGGAGLLLGVGITSLIGYLSPNKKSETSEVPVTPACQAAYYNEYCTKDDSLENCSAYKKKADACSSDSKDEFCKVINDPSKKPASCHVKF